MSNYHDLYRLDGKPIASGGQAEVVRAEHRLTGAVVALKRRNKENAAAADRMRREIQVQSAIQHANEDAYLDFDGDAFEWFTMPLAGAVRQQQRLDAPKSADLSELMILNFKTFDPLH